MNTLLAGLRKRIHQHTMLSVQMCVLGIFLLFWSLPASAGPLAYGLNTYGQLGDGTFTDRKLAVEVTSLTDVTAFPVRFSMQLEEDA